MGDKRAVRAYLSSLTDPEPGDCTKVFSPKAMIAQKALWRDTTDILTNYDDEYKDVIRPE
jgi:hypothetical protein